MALARRLGIQIVLLLFFTLFAAPMNGSSAVSNILLQLGGGVVGDCYHSEVYARDCLGNTCLVLESICVSDDGATATITFAGCG